MHPYEESRSQSAALPVQRRMKQSEQLYNQRGHYVDSMAEAFLCLYSLDLHVVVNFHSTLVNQSI